MRPRFRAEEVCTRSARPRVAGPYVPESEAGSPRCCCTAATYPRHDGRAPRQRGSRSSGAARSARDSGRRCAGEWELRSLRDDPEREYDESTHGEVVEGFRLGESSPAPATGDRPVGERRAVVHYHENTFVLQFPLDGQRTVPASVTRDAGRELLGFVEDCRATRLRRPRRPPRRRRRRRGRLRAA